MKKIICELLNVGLDRLFSIGTLTDEKDVDVLINDNNELEIVTTSGEIYILNIVKKEV